MKKTKAENIATKYRNKRCREKQTSCQESKQLIGKYIHRYWENPIEKNKELKNRRMTNPILEENGGTLHLAQVHIKH